MAAEVKECRFREDLYYRSNGMSLTLPPLRNRVGDIALLLKRFVGPDWSIEPEALAAIEQHKWPGNVRQLINAIERAKILGDDRTITLEDLPAEVTQAQAECSATPPSDDALASIQRSHVLDVLHRAQGNKSRAARLLGVDRRSLYRLLEKYGIQVTEATNGAKTA